MLAPLQALVTQHSAFIGLVMALFTMAAGAYDLMKIIKRQNALLNRVLAHIGVMAVVWCISLASLIMRVDGGAISAPSSMAIIVSILGFAALVVGGWLGGELVYRFGANVTPIAERDQ